MSQETIDFAGVLVRLKPFFSLGLSLRQLLHLLKLEIIWPRREDDWGK